MTDAMDVAAFRQLIYGILKEYRDANQTLDKATVVYKILTHLPSRFESFIRQLQSKRDLPSLNDLFSRLHLEESNIKLRHGSNQEEALIMRIRDAVRSGYRGRGGHHLHYGRRSRGRSESLICNRCGEPRHPARMCRAPAPHPNNFQRPMTYPMTLGNVGTSVRSGLEAHLEEECWDKPTPLNTMIRDNLDTALAALSVDHMVDKDWILDS
jgi:hypothetical protein